MKPLLLIHLVSLCSDIYFFNLNFGFFSQGCDLKFDIILKSSSFFFLLLHCCHKYKICSIFEGCLIRTPPTQQFELPVHTSIIEGRLKVFFLPLVIA